MAGENAVADRNTFEGFGALGRYDGERHSRNESEALHARRVTLRKIAGNSQ
jgi:hypothetical protein